MNHQSSQSFSLLYDQGTIQFKVPTQNLLSIIKPNNLPGVQYESKEILDALKNPLGSKPLYKIAKEKKGKVVIVVNDITRTTPTSKLVLPMLKELTQAGIKRKDITFLVATGTHRKNTSQELEKMLSSEVIRNFNVINHNSNDPEELKLIGTTKRRVPVEINKTFCEADIKILTGTIAPHQSAGYSGGRKSILPGIAGAKALSIHHSYPLRMKGPAMGKIEGNHFSEEAIEAARIVGVDFILNVVQNSKKEIVKVVAGDLVEAWLEGVKWARKVHEVPVSGIKPDIVITSPGGFPRDINLYQTQKSIAPAEIIVKEGGTIIVLSKCIQGIGGGANFYNWLNEANNIEKVIERFKKEGYSESSNKAFLYARALKKAEIIIVTENISSKIFNNIFLKRVDTVEEAILEALLKHGKDCKIVLIKNAPEVVPFFK
jgi:nickel-dependent lactate racemase